MRRFIPLRDRELYGRRPPAERLVPYQPGMPCLHWEAVIEAPEGEQRVVSVLRDRGEGRPPAPHRGAGRPRR